MHSSMYLWQVPHLGRNIDIAAGQGSKTACASCSQKIAMMQQPRQVQIGTTNRWGRCQCQNIRLASISSSQLICGHCCHRTAQRAPKTAPTCP
jgi:hypothetical protein